jgi:hypothetical protein
MVYKDRTTYLSKQRSYYHKDKEAYKWRVIKNVYNITKEEFFDLLESQDNKCALCCKPFTTLKQNDLHIDHCHETGKIRGLLCMQCNVGLGMLGDNEEGLTKAMKYIKGETL